IALIVIGAQIFGTFVTMAQVTQNLIAAVGAAQVDRWVVLVAIIALYLVLGCFIDLVTMLILTVPIVAPLMSKLGYDPVWFAVITILMAEVGMVTPPLGFNVFVISKYTGIPVGDVFRGSYPHVLAHLLLIALLCLFPEIVTWLPSTMK
ncbi:MAG: TRAP transporter large permease subunit, partial [Acidobacteria bacterium]|nr:TRAP transporter large permease subunit [Acidobacteriota bacterium]